MFAKMSGQQLTAESDGAIPLEAIVRSGVRAEPDVAAFASLDKNKLCVMAWHYHDDDVAGPAAAIDLKLHGLPLPRGEMKVQHFRIDQEHSNAFTAWKRMDSPQSPTAEQYRQLERAGQLASLTSSPVRVENSQASLKVELPRQAVSLLVFEW
jgi:xylan 1,4-beta-xylosidase